MGQDYWGIHQPIRYLTDPLELFLFIAQICLAASFLVLTYFVILDNNRTIKTRYMVTVSNVFAVMTLLTDMVYRYVYDASPIAFWFAQFAQSFMIMLVVLMEMELLKIFCKFRSYFTTQGISRMQVAWIIWTLIANVGQFVALGGLGSTPSAFAVAILYPIYVWFFSSGVYVIWQSLYLVHLMLANIKLLKTFQEKTKLSQQKNSVDTLAEPKNVEQTKITHLLLAFAAISCIFVILALVMMVLSNGVEAQDTYSLFRSYCSQLSTIFCTLHILPISYVFKLIQKLAITSIKNPKGGNYSSMTLKKSPDVYQKRKESLEGQ